MGVSTADSPEEEHGFAGMRSSRGSEWDDDDVMVEAAVRREAAVAAAAAAMAWCLCHACLVAIRFLILPCI